MAVAVIVIETGEAALKIHGLAVGARNAVDLIADFEVDFTGPLDVIAHEQVEPSVVVVIEPGAAGAPVLAGAADTGLSRYVLEPPIPFVMEQAVAADRGDKNVRLSIVVVIAGRHAHAVETRIQSRARGDVREAPLAVVVIQGRRS